MRRWALLTIGAAVILVFSNGIAFGDGWAFHPSASREQERDLWVCSAPFEDQIVARLYSYQVPVLIRNEAAPGDDHWAYADACVKAPESWALGEHLDPGFREGQTWGSFEIRYTNPSMIWQATFPPNEDERTDYSADNLNPTGNAKIYIPAFGPSDGNNPPVLLVDAPSLVPIGVSPEIAQTLSDAGLIVEGDRVWSGYSAMPEARAGRNLKPYKVMANWAPAAKLLCDLNTNEKRTGNDQDVARTLMIRAPAFPWHLADDFNCLNSSDKDENGLRKWGGGIVVYHLFPNLEMDPLEVYAENGTVQVSVNFKNQSAAAGPVHLYYRWNSSGVWQLYQETATLQPYQNTSRGWAVAPFTMSLAGPEIADTLTVLAWPDPVTGLTRGDPDLEGAAMDVGILDQAFEGYSVELTLADNWKSVEVQPTFCGDLSVSLDAPSWSSADGFTFTVTAVRQGCEALESILIDAEVNGLWQRQEAFFSGQTATAAFESGPQYGETQVWLSVTVDPENEVAESDETNNWAGQSVGIEEEFLEEITCPTGEPPEKCFRSRLTN